MIPPPTVFHLLHSPESQLNLQDTVTGIQEVGLVCLNQYIDQGIE